MNPHTLTYKRGRPHINKLIYTYIKENMDLLEVTRRVIVKAEETDFIFPTLC